MCLSFKCQLNNSLKGGVSSPSAKLYYRNGCQACLETLLQGYTQFFFSPNFLLDLLFLHFIIVSRMNHSNDLVYISPWECNGGVTRNTISLDITLSYYISLNSNAMKIAYANFLFHVLAAEIQMWLNASQRIDNLSIGTLECLQDVVRCAKNVGCAWW